DHIQGFPFFAPLFFPGNAWDVYAPQALTRGVEAALSGQMEYAYFPVTLAQLGATIRYHEVFEGTFEIGPVRVTTRYLNHPGLALGYRLEAGGTSIVYATDHEPHSVHQSPAGSAHGAAGLPLHPEDQRHVEFLTGADLLIHDSQYTLAEYPAKRNWGHSPAERVVDFAVAARVRHLVLFHHDPLRDDDALDELLEVCRRRADGALHVSAAVEGHVIELAEHAAGRAPSALIPASESAAAAPAGSTILLVDDDPEVLDLLTMTLQPDGYIVLSTTDGETALALARTQRPDLVLLDWSMPGRSGLDVCRALRADPDPRLRDVPVVMLTAQIHAEHTAAGFAAGVSDYVTKPFKPSHIRARVHAWLMRARPR
ncbi:MAG TPA: response regulator, partial [Candidatus Limnocylindrales bacterium]|nr:response regulator [Candidatus Limnocylindrales bacterium]